MGPTNLVYSGLVLQRSCIAKCLDTQVVPAQNENKSAGSDEQVQDTLAVAEKEAEAERLEAEEAGTRWMKILAVL